MKVTLHVLLTALLFSTYTFHKTDPARDTIEEYTLNFESEE
ncbi:hypothetical protein [Winogradskyella sp.]|nr:hypothetical protein [Winogradskyella sp.]